MNVLQDTLEIRSSNVSGHGSIQIHKNNKKKKLTSSSKSVFLFIADCPIACPSHLACIDGRCRDPCNCGAGALCEVHNHRATCRCPVGHQGNPQIRCAPVQDDPCQISGVCGKNAKCELENGNPICYCPKGLTGNPFDECSK